MKTVIEMAREVGAGEPESLYGRTDYVVMTKFELERFAELVRADEREACVQVCEDNATDLSEGDWDSACINCADHIRARGNT